MNNGDINDFQYDGQLLQCNSYLSALPEYVRNIRSKCDHFFPDTTLIQ